MIAAMALFAVEDTFIKAAATTLPIGQTLMLFGIGGVLVFAGMMAFQKQPFFIPDVLSRPMLIRIFFEITGRLFFIVAISLTPLSTATVILQATPLVVVAGAALIFGETVGWRRWTAIFIGLTGVMIIIQPGSEGFSLLSILAVIGMFGFSGRDLASRAAPATLSTSMLGLYGFLSVIIAGGLFALWDMKPFNVPDSGVTLSLIGAIIAGVIGYSCLMKAMRTGEVSAVTPFRYTRLIFGVAFGVLFFGESLSLAMITGSILIVISGLFILWVGKKRSSSNDS
jgi:drug/metabolite transporter (DMT)-like permease